MAEVELNFSNLNFTKETVPQVTGSRFRDFLAETGYDGAEITLFRGLLMRRMLGKYAAEITRGLHAPFPGRTFPEVAADFIFDIRDADKRSKNLKGLAYTAIMPEVRHAIAPMARFQERIGKGEDPSSSQLDAVLYPFSGDNLTPIDFDDEIAPYRNRTFQLTAEVLYRWGIPVNQAMPNDELYDHMRERMGLHGFDALTLDSLHARRQYEDNEKQLYGLPEDFVEYVAMKGLFINAHISVGRTDVLQGGTELYDATIEEAALLTASNEKFWKTQQGQWLRSAFKHYKGTQPFRMTKEQPQSAAMKDGRIVDLAKYRDENALLKDIEAAA